MVINTRQVTNIILYFLHLDIHHHIHHLTHLPLQRLQLLLIMVVTQRQVDQILQQRQHLRVGVTIIIPLLEATHLQQQYKRHSLQVIQLLLLLIQLMLL